MTPGEDLTPRQWETLRAIRLHLRAHGRPPTLRELGDVLGIGSTNGVSDHLRALERKGYVERTAMTSRGIALTTHAYKAFARVGGSRWLDPILGVDVGPFVDELDTGATCA